MSDDMLPVTEWPGLAVIVLDVSLETRDKGLGMNSKVSEKPTRALGAGLTSSASGAGVSVVLLSCGSGPSSGSSSRSALISGSGGVGGSCGWGNETNSAFWKSVGLFGALLPFVAGSLNDDGRIGIAFDDTALETPRR